MNTCALCDLSRRQHSMSERATAARETVALQAAEAREAAQLAMATASSLREAAALEAQLMALQAAPAPALPGGDPNSRIADSLARLGWLSRAHLSESAHGAADVTVLSRAEVAALTPETESIRLSLQEGRRGGGRHLQRRGRGHQLPRTPASGREDRDREARTVSHRCLLHLEHRQDQGAGDRQGPRHLPRALRGAEGLAQAAASSRQVHVRRGVPRRARGHHRLTEKQVHFLKNQITVLVAGLALPRQAPRASAAFPRKVSRVAFAYNRFLPTLA